jgi:CDP-glucose 4,6-dehydratase
MVKRKCALENLELNKVYEFWRGKNVLVTGHTGFKGVWLSIWLQRMGAKVSGIALEPNTNPSLYNLFKISNSINSFILDIREPLKLANTIEKIQPEIVFHLAAQPLVSVSYKYPLDTYSINIMGTANLLEALRAIESLKVAIMITTDKVYRNIENNVAFKEIDHLGGYDPYSASKAACEIVIDSFRSAYFGNRGVAIASARAGNVIGGGDWSLDRLIPDAVRAWSSNKSLIVRNPNAVRPWQHVLEPINGYLLLAQNLWTNPGNQGAYNFGPSAEHSDSVENVINLARIKYGKGKVIYEKNDRYFHEANFLSLDTSKTEKILGLQQRWSLDETILKTMIWYLLLINGNNALELCNSDINDFEKVNK